MKKLLVAFTSLASLTIVTHGQIPPWTREQLVRFYGSRAVNVEGEGSQIKSISFVKQHPHSWHGGECFTLVIGVLRGPGGKDIGGEPEIHVDDNGVWHDSITGCDVANPDSLPLLRSVTECWCFGGLSFPERTPANLSC